MDNDKRTRGYVKEYRSALDNPLFNEKPFDRWHAFEYCQLKANHKPAELIYGNQTITVDRGQFFTSMAGLATTFGWSVKKVRAWLNLLEKMKMLTSKGLSKGTIITVEKYSFYQGEGQSEDIAEEPPSGEHRASTGNTNKNVKNIKNDKEVYTSENHQRIIDLYNGICKSLPKCIKLSETRKRHIKARLKDGYGEEDFRKVFEKAEASDFLTGKAQKWKANFDWLINENNLLKVLEGNYDNKTAAGNPFEF